jgi:hypothetical protein
LKPLQAQSMRLECGASVQPEAAKTALSSPHNAQRVRKPRRTAPGADRW